MLPLALCAAVAAAVAGGCSDEPAEAADVGADGGTGGTGATGGALVGGTGGGTGATGGTQTFAPFFTPPVVPTEPGVGGLESLSVEPVDPIDDVIEIGFGDAVEIQLAATGNMEGGSTEDLTDEVTWTPGIAVATASGGLFSTSVPGVYTVEARSGSVVGQYEVTVRLSASLAPDETPADWPADPLGLITAAADGAEPSIVYPLDGAMFPKNFGAPEFHVAGAAGRSVALVHFEGDAIDLRVLEQCSPVAGTDGCKVRVGADLVEILVGASEAETLTARVRLMNTDGTDLGQSAAIDVRWATTELSGAIYYWRSGGRRQGTDDPLSTSIARLDLSDLSVPVQPYWSQPTETALTPLVAPPWDGAQPSDIQTPCVGCHAISHDGRTLAVSLGGSDAASFALIDVASRTIIDQRMVDGLHGVGFAQFTAFSPGGTRMVNTMDGHLYLRHADPGLADERELLFPGVAEPISHPFWAERAFVFVGYPGPSQNDNSDLVQNGQIWLAHANGMDIDTAQPPLLLVPRVGGVTQFFPSVSSDGAWVAYVVSRCDGPATAGAPYGAGACDGYDDISSTLYLVPIGGGAPIELVRANGGANLSNSWPRFSPNRGQEYRGRTLHWIAFSSRRSYGLDIVNANPQDHNTSPQLWFAAVALPADGTPPEGDPSFAPIWMPSQNEDNTNPTGNHVPQWTTQFVLPE